MLHATCRDDDLERIHHLVRQILDENHIEHSALMITPIDLHVSGAVHADVTIELAYARKVSIRVCATAFDTPAELALRIAHQLMPE
jgi:hypothetical protein